MRNDVKLGFAIGGVLLAVLIVYVLVVPGGSSTSKQAKLDLSAKKTDSGKVTLEPVFPATQVSAPPAAPAGTFNPGTPAAPTTQAGDVAMNDQQDSDAAKVTDPTPPAKSKDLDWGKLLNGQTLTGVTETPTPASNSHSSQGGEGRTTPVGLSPVLPQNVVDDSNPEPVHTSGGSVNIDPLPVSSEPKPISNKQLATASTRPSGVASLSSHTHRVAQGETLSTIAAAAYGNPNLWPAIVKANPNLDPNRMKVNQVINLPDIADAKPAQSSSAQTAGTKISPNAPIDSAKQYRVQSGDSMYKISVKLYGNSKMGEKIYELNKAKIGDDPARLKAGQVLELPEPPTVTTSTR